MKIKANGGNKAFLQTQLGLQKFTAHLNLSSNPVARKKNYRSENVHGRLSVNNRGRLQVSFENPAPVVALDPKKASRAVVSFFVPGIRA